MKRLVWVAMLWFGGLMLGGCESIATRIRERETAFGSWSAMTQERIRRGEIKVGDSFDMVYIALGAPDGMQTFTAEDGGVVTVWDYPKIRQRYVGEETVNYEDVSEFNIATGERTHYQIPNRQKTYRTAKEAGMQVIFRGGLVSSVRWGGQTPPAKR